MKTLQDYIKLAESATDGPFMVDKDLDNPERFMVRQDGYDGWIICGIEQSIDEDDSGEHHAKFVAQSLNFGPEMAKALIEAEEALRAYHEKERLGYCSESSSYNLSDTPAAKALAQIQALQENKNDAIAAQKGGK